MPTASHSGRWALAICVCLLLAALAAWGFVRFGIFPSLNPRGWLAIGITVLIVAGKMMLKGVLKKPFELHEQGHEVSLLAVGAAVPTAADYFMVDSPHRLEWVIFAFASAFGTVLAVLCSTAAEESPKENGKISTGGAWWTAGSVFLGVSFFIFYMFLVLLKTR